MYHAAVKYSQGQMVWCVLAGMVCDHLLQLMAAMYIAIPVIENFYPNNDYYFQEDNATCHTAKPTKRFIEEKQIHGLLPVQI